MATAQQSSLKQLVARRGQIKAACTRAKTYIESLNISEVSLIEVKQRKLKFEQCWENFNSLQEQIEMLQDQEESAEEHEKERAEFELQYFHIVTKFEEVVVFLSEPIAVPSTLQVNNGNNEWPSLHAQIRLPRIDLPTFSGAYEEWFPFFDTFNSLIHSDQRLKNAQKFQYLKSSLQGDAATLIKSLEISDVNYIEAWNMLKERYDSKRVIIQKHIRSIFDLPALQKENGVGLRHLVDGMLKNLRALKALGRSTNAWDDVIICILTSKLDNVTRKAWEVSIPGTDMPTLQQLLDFLSQRCQALETIAKEIPEMQSSGKVTRNKGALSHVSVSGKPFCPSCKGNHHIYQCGSFLKLAVEDRIKKISSLKLCSNCLRTTAHRANVCEWGVCKKCGKRHSTLLHKAESTASGNVSVRDTENSASSSKQTQAASVVRQAFISTKADTLLSTAVIFIKDSYGNEHACRAFLDAGSQSNFITGKMIDKLALNKRSTDVPVLGFHKGRTQIHYEVEVEIRSRLNKYKTKLNCLVIDNITTSIPLVSFERDAVKIPANIKLADPEFHVSAEIDILIGVDAFWRLICVGQIRTADSQPLLQKTHLGWILAGDFVSTSPTKSTRCCNFSIKNNLDSILKRFWELEQGESKNELSPEERLCDEYYLRTFRRTDGGRFIVSLPVKQEKLANLGQSKDTATRRFFALERRLDKEPEIKAQYINFMREYEQLGHMRSIDTQECNITPNYYLPHHAVVKESSLTTRLRVVFDASCKTSTGISLNDILLVGPTLQQDLFSILVRFRAHYYVLTADIAKMYRQVLVNSSQTPLQRIVWRESLQDDLKTYELLTVTYGTAPAAFLSIKTLQQLALLEAKKYPLGSAIALRDFYVDDLLTGSNSKSELKNVRDELIGLLDLAGFKLRKWLSNEPELLRDLTANSDPHSILHLDKGDFTSTLGIKWNANRDIFQYDSVNICSSSERITKRTILSTIAKVFDPLGLLGPIMLSAKIIMQRLWVLKVHWDEALPMEIHCAWKRLESEWLQLRDISVPRKILINNNPRDIQIHGFSDASQDGYGACIYIRSADQEGNYCVRLLCAKSRVSPLRSVSLPRLELCGALLLAELASKILKALPFDCRNVYFWTDSGIVLSWIHSSSRRWVTFVANRVGAIQELSGAAKWQHVSGRENPADLISRGATPAALKQSQLWWNGPPWLSRDSSFWPRQTAFTPPQELPEHRSISIAMTTKKDSRFYDRFSSFQKMIRVIAYCRRFIHNSRRSHATRLLEPLTPNELSTSTDTILRAIQREEFPTEIKLLLEERGLSRSSKLLNLNPFMKDNLIRVGGRLQNSGLPYHSKHPVILPAKHPVTELIIEHFHKRQLHAGAQGTLAAVRECYWPLAARHTVRKIIRQCVTCFKASPQPSQHIMGNLPAHRTKPGRPFSIVGVDYCGPFYIREGTRKNTKKIKSYVLIFVCMSTKAIHIELVLDMTTESYLAAFKRFLSRRGRPMEVHSDNGSTFVGANNELRELYDMFTDEERCNKIITTLAMEGTSWKFIPPRAPHFGGIWEAAVRATKHHLIRVAGEASLNYVQLYTLLTQVEAVLNSRPLTPLSNDPNDFSFLSPAHFLIGAPLTSLPEPDLTCTKLNLLSKWQHIEQLKQHFWHRWVKEYLHLCQQRPKWKESRGLPLKVGDLVIIHDDNAPPLHWSMGRVEAVHPGKDGVVRAATVKTTKGSFKRPSTKLHVLPVSQ